MDEWRARTEWVRPDGAPDLDALVALAGAGCPVCITDTQQQQQGDGSGRVEEVPLGDYLRWWRSRGPAPRQGQQQPQQPQVQWPPLSPEQAATAGGGAGVLSSGTGHWYLKDWHFVAQAPPGYEVRAWVQRARVCVPPPE